MKHYSNKMNCSNHFEVVDTSDHEQILGYFTQSPDFDSFNPNVLLSFSDWLRKHFLFTFNTLSLGNILRMLY